MAKKLCILACDLFRQELTTAVESEGLDDVAVATFPARCGRPQIEWDSLAQAIRADEDCSCVQIIGGGCLAGLGDPPQQLEHCHLYKIGQCFCLFAGRSVIDGYLKEGAYLLTPGWLARWRDWLNEWGFDQQTAREYFAESTTRLLLLDTGVDAQSDQNLHEFADFIGRPFETVPVGLDYLHLLLAKMVLEWRLNNERAITATVVNDTRRQMADYAMALDLLSNLTQTMDEAEAFENILNLFSILYAPGELGYVPLQDGKPDLALSCPLSSTDIAAITNRLAGLGEEYAWTESGNGFLLRINYGSELLGVLMVDEIAFPEYKEHYLNLALAIAGVCGLAIHNTRIFQQLSVRNEELDAFAHTVAHDLKNPVSQSIGYAELLEQDYKVMSDNERQAALHALVRNGFKISNILDELLLLAGVRKTDVPLAPLDMGNIVAEAQQRLKYVIEERQAEIVLPAAWPTALGYGPWVEEVWANYLSNGYKYGGTPLRLELGADPPFTSPPPPYEGKQTGGTERRYVRFWVRDNGNGITPEDQARLFTPFTRLDQARAKGHGLGLSIVRRIVEKLGGQVGVESDGVPGHGSVFSFTLPAAPQIIAHHNAG
jgi:signal transduction histidine kinase